MRAMFATVDIFSRISLPFPLSHLRLLSHAYALHLSPVIAAFALKVLEKDFAPRPRVHN